MRLKILIALGCLLQAGCATYPDVKEIKLVGFTEDINRGKASRPVTADDCVYQLFGYQLGNYPELSQALGNARTAKTSTVQDLVVHEQESRESFRYINHVQANYSGFSAGFFGKTCIEVKGVGYL